MKVFSFDAESNGLWGTAFAIGAIVYDEGGIEIARFVGRLPDTAVTDKWARENVLPNTADIPVTHSYEALLASFAEFYMKHKVNADIIAHMGVPVEAKLLWDMHSKGFIGNWDGPYPFLDVATALKAKGEDPTSVDKYNERHGLMAGRPEAEGLATHHPLYDSVAAAVAYMNLIGG